MVLPVIMKRTTSPIILMAAIIISPLGIGNQATNVTLPASPKNCSYSIEIETTCASSADTKYHISVRFSDSAGNLIIVKPLKNPKLLYAPKGFRKQGGAYRGFERCVIDMFEASGTCMKQGVCSLYLKKVGSDNWRPGWVKALHQEDIGHLEPVSYILECLCQTMRYGFDYSRSKEGSTPSIASFGGDD